MVKVGELGLDFLRPDIAREPVNSGAIIAARGNDRVGIEPGCGDLLESRGNAEHVVMKICIAIKCDTATLLILIIEIVEIDEESSQSLRTDSHPHKLGLLHTRT